MTPLIHAPSVIPQLILSLCTVSIATCNKLFENMTLFNGDQKDTKIIGTVNGKNFYWKIDTGSAVTCMNINAFETAFGKTKERNQKDFKTDIFIKKRKCTHTVQIYCFKNCFGTYNLVFAVIPSWVSFFICTLGSF